MDRISGMYCGNTVGKIKSRRKIQRIAQIVKITKVNPLTGLINKKYSPVNLLGADMALSLSANHN